MENKDYNKGEKPTFKERLQYKFDNIMSSGMRAKIGILFLIMIGLGLISGLLLMAFLGKRVGKFDHVIWISFMHLMDPGTLAADQGHKFFILIMLFATVAGMIITSTLIGIINNGLEDKMNDLRQGKSRILEKGHTIIFGFNETTFTILEELIESNANHNDRVIVVMDECGKVEMEDAISRRIPDTKTTRIICRMGCIYRMEDIRICSPETCRAIILNTNDDFTTIKALLASSTVLEETSNRSAFITACIRDVKNIDAAQIAAQGRAELLYFEEALSRIMAHTCREAGLTKVFTELFNFQGDEFYREHISGLEGKTLGEINLTFEHSTAIGFIRRNPDDPDHDLILINPDVYDNHDHRLQPDDDLIILEEDDGVTRSIDKSNLVKTEYFTKNMHSPEEEDVFLVIGSRPILKDVLLEEDYYVIEGSTAYVFDSDLKDEYLPDPDSLQNLRVIPSLAEGDIVTKDDLEYILVSEKEKHINSILVLSDPALGKEEADSKTLAMLLNLRDIANKHPDLQFTITSQMNSVKNQELAEVARVNDFVISQNIIALLMSQISQTRELNQIFDTLLSNRDSEIYMKRASNYIRTGVPVNMYTVTASASRYKEIVIGYKIYQNDTDYQVIINPAKSKEISFSDRDYIIVIAQNP